MFASTTNTTGSPVETQTAQGALSNKRSKFTSMLKPVPFLARPHKTIVSIYDRLCGDLLTCEVKDSSRPNPRHHKKTQLRTPKPKIISAKGSSGENKGTKVPSKAEFEANIQALRRIPRVPVELTPAQKRAAITYCYSNKIEFTPSEEEKNTEVSNPYEPSAMKKRMYSRIAREAVKAKINSHRFPNHRDLSPSRVANVISISALPDLQRYSTSNSLHGTSPLGQGTRENGLSYGKVNKSGMIAKVLSRIHLLFRKGEPKPYTPQRVRLEIFTPQPKGDKPTATATPFTPDPVTYRVQFVIRNGREEWGKKVEAA